MVGTISRAPLTAGAKTRGEIEASETVARLSCQTPVDICTEWNLWIRRGPTEIPVVPLFFHFSSNISIDRALFSKIHNVTWNS
jgi:hypothetical protein